MLDFGHRPITRRVDVLDEESSTQKARQPGMTKPRAARHSDTSAK